ncbi:MAG: hypothetical protein U0228_07350 [Myxococcaceae bacterium]
MLPRRWRESWLRLSTPASIRAQVERDAATPQLPLRVGSAEVELIALVIGLKPVVRQWLSADNQAHLERVLPPGFTVEVTEPLGRRLAFIGRDAERVKDAVRAEVEVDDAALGAALGYPPCCVDAFLAQTDTVKVRDRTPLALARACAARSRRADARLNNLDLGLFHWISWSPCSFDCAASLEWVSHAADAFLAYEVSGKRRDARRHAAVGDFVRRADALLRAHRVWWNDAQVSVEGVRQGQRLLVRSAWPTWRDHPSGGLSPELKERAVLVAAALTHRHELTLRDADVFSFE